MSDEIVLLVFFTWLSWRGEESIPRIIASLFSGLLSLFIAPGYLSTYPGIALVLYALPVLQLSNAVTIAAHLGGPARGWSQFKGYYQAIRGRIG